MHVAFCADNNFVIPMATAARSLLENIDVRYQTYLYLLSDGISERNKQKINQSLDFNRTTITWYEVKDALDQNNFRNLPTRLPKVAFGRLLLPSVIPKDIDWVLYLDCDLIVVDDVSKMFEEFKSTAHPISAAPNLGPSLFQDALHLRHVKAAQNIPKNTGYFNSGVQIINLTKWRQEDISSKIFQFVKTHYKTLRFTDQDASNIIISGNWKRIPSRWNQIHLYHTLDHSETTGIGAEEWHKARTNPGIIHFTTLKKPWHNTCLHPNIEDYFTYLDRTAYAGWRNTIARRAFKRLAEMLTTGFLPR